MRRAEFTFTIHPNRKLSGRVNEGEIEAFASRLEYFFDPEIMVKYRPDYESLAQYQKKVQESPIRSAVVRAAAVRVGSLDKPTTRFVKRDEAGFVNALTTAQQQAAKLEPELQGWRRFYCLPSRTAIKRPHRAG